MLYYFFLFPIEVELEIVRPLLTDIIYMDQLCTLLQPPCKIDGSVYDDGFEPGLEIAQFFPVFCDVGKCFEVTIVEYRKCIVLMVGVSFAGSKHVVKEITIHRFLRFPVIVPAPFYPFV